MRDVGRFVATSANGLRREVGAVRLDEEAVGGDAARGGTQVVGVLVRHVAGERHVPAVRECGLEERLGGEAVENHRPADALEPPARVVIRRPCVDDHRLAGVSRDGELPVEEPLLQIVGRVIAEVVEARLPYGDCPGCPSSAQLVDVLGLATTGLVRMNPECGVDAFVRVRELERAGSARERGRRR